jgi:DNA-binding response OmpR family regulator
LPLPNDSGFFSFAEIEGARLVRGPPCLGIGTPKFCTNEQTTPVMKILVIEDNVELLHDIQNFLEREGNVCEVAPDYRTAYMKVGIFPYDIIVVDITLPDGSGLDIIREVKKENIDVGIIIISAKNGLDDKVHGLEIGADDYLTKPFYLPELNARINALYRRKVYHGSNEIIFNEIKIEPEKHEVYVKGHPLSLTKKEFDILHFFVANKNRLLTKEAIAEHLWGDHIEMADSFNFIYTHLANLRKKIGERGGHDYIKSIYRVGYKFTDME